MNIGYLESQISFVFNTYLFVERKKWHDVCLWLLRREREFVCNTQKGRPWVRRQNDHTHHLAVGKQNRVTVIKTTLPLNRKREKQKKIILNNLFWVLHSGMRTSQISGDAKFWSAAVLAGSHFSILNADQIFATYDGWDTYGSHGPE